MIKDIQLGEYNQQLTNCSLMLRFVDDTFDPEISATIGMMWIFLCFVLLFYHLTEISHHLKSILKFSSILSFSLMFI